jgi:hypothetical protein
MVSWSVSNVNAVSFLFILKNINQCREPVLKAKYNLAKATDCVSLTLMELSLSCLSKFQED